MAWVGCDKIGVKDGMEMEIDTESGNVNECVHNVHVEECIHERYLKVENLTREHDKTVCDLLSKNESLIKSIEKLNKEHNEMKNEVKQVKEENKKLSVDIGKLQYEKETIEFKIKLKKNLIKSKKTPNFSTRYLRNK